LNGYNCALHIHNETGNERERMRECEESEREKGAARRTKELG